MTPLYYRSAVGNFGDDLNAWLWPRLFGDHFDRRPEICFVGIGSILDARVPKEGRKLVFGAGARSEGSVPRVDGSWDIRFVRGPLTAGALGPRVRHITDGAACVRLLALEPPGKRTIFGLMPHFLSMEKVCWERVCRWAGYELINPCWPVERVLQAIGACGHLVTEAMHGAIIADCLRVPWLRATFHSCKIEGNGVSEFKWKDWGSGVGVEIATVGLPWIWSRRESATLRAAAKRKILLGKMVVRLIQLKRAGKFRLSADGVLARVTEQLAEEVDNLRRELAAMGTGEGAKV